MEENETNHDLRRKIEDVLSKVKPSLGGADLRLKEVTQGLVTVGYYRHVSNPFACHVDPTAVTTEIVKEVLEEHLKK